MDGIAADSAVREPQIGPPQCAEHRPGGLRLDEPLADRAVTPHLAASQITQAHPVSERRVLGQRGADADFDVVRVRTECEYIDGLQGRGHLVQPKTSSALSERPRNACSRMRDATKAPVTLPDPPRANR